MKKTILIFTLFLVFFSQTYGQIIEPFIKENLNKIKNLNTISILNTRIEKPNYILSLLKDSMKNEEGKSVEGFNFSEYDILYKESIVDTRTEYWTEKDKITFGIDDLYNSDNTQKNESFYLKYKNQQFINYSFSKPMVLKNGLQAIFFFERSSVWCGGIFEKSVIVMKKEKGKWCFYKKIKANLIQGSITVKKSKC